VRYAPSTPLTYLFLGLVPMLVWLPRGVLRLDASRPAHAVAAGLAVTSVNLVAGVAGPLLDVFFVRTSLGRHAVVATKAATQVLSHTAKVLLYGGRCCPGAPTCRARPAAGRAAVDARHGGRRTAARPAVRRVLPRRDEVGRVGDRCDVPRAGRPARLTAAAPSLDRVPLHPICTDLDLEPSLLDVPGGPWRPARRAEVRSRSTVCSCPGSPAARRTSAARRAARRGRPRGRPARPARPAPVTRADDPSAYTVEALGRDLLAVVDELREGPVHLVGHSFGGLVARAAVLRRPRRSAR
jgi:hypothetical protein